MVDAEIFMIISAFSAPSAFFASMLFGGGLLAAAGLAFAAGFGLPRWGLSYLKKRREENFLKGLPDAVDVIVRGIKAGLPLFESIKVVAADAPEPLKSEFLAIIETQAIGMPLGDACARLYERMPVPEANFFGIVIAIQQKSGGNLSEALGNLSKVLRDRKKMAEKIQAMSMEAKASAGIIGSLPPIVMLLVYLSTPRLHLAAVDPSDRTVDARRLRDVDVHRHLRDEENDQLRLLTVQHDFVPDRQAPRRALHDHAARRHRRERHGLHADHAVVRGRRSAKAHEGGRERARADPAARARAPLQDRKGFAAPDAKATRLQGGGGLQPREVAGAGGRARKADDGRLSRPGALRHLPVLPAGDA